MPRAWHVRVCSSSKMDVVNTFIIKRLYAILTDFFMYNSLLQKHRISTFFCLFNYRQLP